MTSPGVDDRQETLDFLRLCRNCSERGALARGTRPATPASRLVIAGHEFRSQASGHSLRTAASRPTDRLKDEPKV